MNPAVLAFLVTAVLATLLSIRYGRWTTGAVLVVFGFSMFIVLFFTPLGRAILPDSGQLVAQIGAWRWVFAITFVYVTIFSIAVAVNTEKETVARLKRGYQMFHGLTWSELGPLTFILALTGAGYDLVNPPEAIAAQIAAPPPGGWEQCAGFVALAAILIIGVTYLLWRRR